MQLKNSEGSVLPYTLVHLTDSSGTRTSENTDLNGTARFSLVLPSIATDIYKVATDAYKASATYIDEKGISYDVDLHIDVVIINAVPVPSP